jgi:hypothetical protein
MAKISLTSGTGEAMATAKGKAHAKGKRTKIQIAAERDAKAQAERQYATTVAAVTNVINSLLDNTFIPADGCSADTFAKWVYSLKAADAKRMCTIASVSPGKAPAEALVTWFKAGGKTPRQMAEHLWKEKDVKFVKLADDVYSAAELKEYYLKPNGLKLGGSKGDLLSRLRRFLKGELLAEDKARELKKASPSTDRAEQKRKDELEALKVAMSTVKPDLSDEELTTAALKFLEAKAASARLRAINAAKKAAAAKIPAIF